MHVTATFSIIKLEGKSLSDTLKEKHIIEQQYYFRAWVRQYVFKI